MPRGSSGRCARIGPRPESRLAAREIAPLVLQPTKGARKRIRKPNTRQLHIMAETAKGAAGAGDADAASDADAAGDADAAMAAVA